MTPEELLAVLGSGTAIVCAGIGRWSSDRSGLWDFLRDAMRGRAEIEMERERRATMIAVLMARSVRSAHPDDGEARVAIDRCTPLNSAMEGETEDRVQG